MPEQFISGGMMNGKRILVNSIIYIACSLLTSCGTYIPNQRDWPNTKDTDNLKMNAALARTVVCELSYAVTIAIRNDLKDASSGPHGKAYSLYLEKWGVEVATDLTVTENSTLAPAFDWTPDKPISIGGGLSVGAVATNETQYNMFFPLAALYKPNLFHLLDDTRPCRESGHKEGSPLVDIDLRILPTLESRLVSVRLGLADAPSTTNLIQGEKNVLSQTVSIKETVSGDITPKWVFSTKTIDGPGTTLFKAGRDKTHQLVFTFGPMSPDAQGLNTLAEAFHLTQVERAGLRNNR
jgi:hypothetical protein